MIIEDSGHTISFDQPDRFNEVLLEFLRDTATTQRSVPEGSLDHRDSNPLVSRHPD
jgi:hypothetical protein